MELILSAQTHTHTHTHTLEHTVLIPAILHPKNPHSEPLTLNLKPGESQGGVCLLRAERYRVGHLCICLLEDWPCSFASVAHFRAPRRDHLRHVQGCTHKIMPRFPHNLLHTNKLYRLTKMIDSRPQTLKPLYPNCLISQARCRHINTVGS